MRKVVRSYRMVDTQEVERVGLEEALGQMPAAAFIAKAPSGKLVLVNEQAQRTIEQNLGRSVPQALSELGVFGDLTVVHPDGRPPETEE